MKPVTPPVVKSVQKSPTHNPLEPDVRKKVAGILTPRLMESIHLYTQLKEAHWNVRGQNFIAIHELFDDVAKDAQAWADLLAERIRQLGYPAPGDAKIVAERSTLAPYPAGLTTSSEHVQAVTKQLASFSESVGQAIDATDEAGDPVSADVCTEIARASDKWLWFVESHDD